MIELFQQKIGFRARLRVLFTGVFYLAIQRDELGRPAGVQVSVKRPPGPGLTRGEIDAKYAQYRANQEALAAQQALEELTPEDSEQRYEEPKPGVANIETRDGVPVLSGRMTYPEPAPMSRQQRRAQARNAGRR